MRVNNYGRRMIELIAMLLLLLFRSLQLLRRDGPVRFDRLVRLPSTKRTIRSEMADTERHKTRRNSVANRGASPYRLPGQRNPPQQRTGNKPKDDSRVTNGSGGAHVRVAEATDRRRTITRDYNMYNAFVSYLLYFYLYIINY
ncbi:unnamed protein product [Aphis gossypii]|uniref:Uncharacterized protein n=1 Tax=Aphis gossypii TaxID=80765 RepID=A0A9P0IV50_APHGO|nr:unnamed protein product [Aphis gossypii]